jgi:predicted adenylyl cyclase CyaB
MLEIELKARLGDVGMVEDRLSQFMEYEGKIEKDDEYWSIPITSSFIPSAGFRLRVRMEPGKATVTFKEKTYTHNIEVNKETEFGVLDAIAFRVFLEKMSAKLLYKKRKVGTSWKGEGGIVAELVSVDGLGDYLEVETLREESEDVDVEAVKKVLLHVVDKCGLKLTDIEPRPYSLLLGMPSY